MSLSRIIISNFQTGLELDREPFIINNDAFPVMQNVYNFRGRIYKKPGTRFLGRLQRNLTSQSLGNIGNGATNPIVLNIFSLVPGSLSGNIVPGSVVITVAAPGTATFTDNGDTTFTVTGAGVSVGSFINYATGAVTLEFTAPIAASAATSTFGYYPDLPVMGLRSFETTTINLPTLVAFDTTYSYQFNQSTKVFYDVSFYKTSHNPVTWSGQNYQQFYTTNYFNALWATNNNPGMHFETISAITVGNPTIITTAAPHNLSTGDIVWFNEVTGADANLLNFQTASITKTGANTFTVPINTTGKAINNSGIFQILTQQRGVQGDGIRWYDGDPSGASGLGWVNFAPPLTNVAQPEYLAGCVAILPFRDRLLCFGITTIQSNGTQIFYQDRVAFSQNGTPFYTTLVPNGITPPAAADSSAWYQNVPGKGGYVAAGIQQEIVEVGNNEDVLIVGFERRKTKLVYTSNDLIPFIFYTVNSELGSESTFSQITLDTGSLCFGSYGIVMATQNEAQRIDLIIPDIIFDVQQTSNGVERVNAVRDYRNEWVYWSYPFFQNPWIFPTQTLNYNYRDNTWAIFIENFTTHGSFREGASDTWASLPYTAWTEWNVPWNFGEEAGVYPLIIGGNQQGYVLIKDPDISSETTSGFINNITVASSQITVNSPNHCLLTGDYIYITGCLGLTAGAGNPNGTVRQVTLIPTGMAAPNSFDANNFIIDNQATAANPTPLFPSGTYLGGGQFTRLTVPYLQTKMFNPGWPGARKTRIGTQRYLFDTTPNGEVTANIFLSQDNATPWTSNFVVPNPHTFNSSLVFSNIVLTRPEPMPVPYSNVSIGTLGNGILTSFSFNLFTILGFANGQIKTGSVYIVIGAPGNATYSDNGSGGFVATGTGVALGSSINYLTGAVVLVTSVAINASPASTSFYFESFQNIQSSQNQIWHRQSTSLLGDTVQLAITLSDAEMRDPTLQIQNSDIGLHAIVIDVYPGANLV